MVVNTTDYICIKDDQLQSHSRKIERLEARSESRDATITDIKRDMEKMDKKLDALLEGFNELKLESNKDDTKLELRLKAIETKLEANEKAIKDNRDKSSLQVTIIGLIFSAIMIIIAIFPYIID